MTVVQFLVVQDPTYNSVVYIEQLSFLIYVAISMIKSMIDQIKKPN